MTVNRIDVLVAAICALLGAAAPIIADADWTTTVGIVTGILTLVKLVDRWLQGWQAHEERTHWRENAGGDQIEAALEPEQGGPLGVVARS